ncbi:unnamed protein product, partial [marine sediment metagenome]
HEYLDKHDIIAQRTLFTVHPKTYNLLTQGMWNYTITIWTITLEYPIIPYVKHLLNDVFIIGEHCSLVKLQN